MIGREKPAATKHDLDPALLEAATLCVEAAKHTATSGSRAPEAARDYAIAAERLVAAYLAQPH